MNQLLGMYPEKMKALNLKRYMHSNVRSSTVYNSQDIEATHLSTDRWYYTHTHTMDCYSAIEKEWNNGICSNMKGLEIVVQSEVSSEKRISCDSTYVWNLIKMIQMNLFTKQRDSQAWKTNLWLPKGEGERDKLGVWD